MTGFPTLQWSSTGTPNPYLNCRDFCDAYRAPSGTAQSIYHDNFARATTFAAAESVFGTVSSPVNSVLPTISGTTQSGSTLTATNGTWTGNPTSYTYQWLRCNSSGTSCVSISGATSQSYVLTSSDINNTIRVRVTAINAQGSTFAESSATSVITSGSGSLTYQHLYTSALNQATSPDYGWDWGMQYYDPGGNPEPYTSFTLVASGITTGLPSGRFSLRPSGGVNAIEGLKKYTLVVGARQFIGFMVKFPSNWVEPSTAGWGMAINQPGYQGCSESTTGSFAHSDHVRFTVLSGEQSWPQGTGEGKPVVREYDGSDNGAQGPAPRIIPVGRMTLNVWHQLIYDITWSPVSTSSPRYSEIGIPGAVRVYHRIMGESIWNQTMDKPDIPTLQWGPCRYGGVWPFFGTGSDVAHKFGAYRGGSTLTLPIEHGNISIGTTFDAVAATMPGGSGSIGTVQLEDSFEVAGSGTGGLRNDLAIASTGTGSVWPTWGVNTNHANSGFLVETPSISAGKGTKALKIITVPAETGQSYSHTFLSQGTFHRDSRASGQNNGDEYWGFMIYLPTDWTWGWSGQIPDWGAIFFEANYPPFITPNGPFRLQLEPGGATGTGSGTLRAQIKGGYGEQPQWAQGIVTTTYSGHVPLNPGVDRASQSTFPAFGTTALQVEQNFKVIPQGQFDKGVWHEVILHVRWTVGIEQGGVSPMWRSWWRRKGESTWNLTMNVSGADHSIPNRAASLLWGKESDGTIYTPDMYLPSGPSMPNYTRTVGGVKRISTYTNFGGYYVSSNATGTHTYWLDNMINGDSFDSIASRMP